MIKQQLDSIRSEIDAIDQNILAQLIDRTKLVKQVGQIKKANRQDVSVIRAGREAIMLRDLTTKAYPNLPKEFVGQIWRLIISASLNIEEKFSIAVCTQHSEAEGYWRAREYFGSFTNIIQSKSAEEIFNDVANRKHSVAVFGVADEDCWYSLSQHSNIQIFAEIPFIVGEDAKDLPKLYAAALVETEKTGDDRTIGMISRLDGSEILQEEVVSLLASSYDCEILTSFIDKKHVIFEVNDFIGEGSIDIFGAYKVKVFGNYASPIIL
jgi:chorismate mutase